MTSNVSCNVENPIRSWRAEAEVDALSVAPEEQNVDVVKKKLTSMAVPKKTFAVIVHLFEFPSLGHPELATLRELRLLPPFTRVCLNFIHFDTQSRNQDMWLPSKRLVVATAVYSRLFEILTTLTFGALRKNHIMSKTFEDTQKNKIKQ